MINSLKALSLFSGAGGLDIGVMQAGFEILACVEIDPYACETLRANIEREHRKTKVFEQDIREIDVYQMMRDLNLQPGELDLLFGGPPCQPFSQIGKRKSLSDDRGLLLFEMVRFAQALKPRAILIEQVKGLINAPDQNGIAGNVFKKLIDELENLGYNSKWKLINAADYGVPQLRQRVFIVSTKEKMDFHFPEPTHSAKAHKSLFFTLLPYVTAGEALQGLATPCQINGNNPCDSHVDVTPEGDRRRINGVPEGSHLAAQTHLPAEQRRNLTKKDTTKFKRLSRSEPANTLRCGEIFFHPTENRYLTPREYMRLHGYPDDYILKGPIRGRSGRVRYLDQHRQVANSVPPPVARIIAQAILESLYASNI